MVAQITPKPSALALKSIQEAVCNQTGEHEVSPTGPI